MLETDSSRNGGAEIPLPPPQARPAASVVPALEPEPVVSAAPTQDLVLFGRLLRMADGYAGQGSVRQALEMYWQLIGAAAGTSFAEQARQRVLDIATRYETEGKLHQARALYEKLLGGSE